MKLSYVAGDRIFFVLYSPRAKTRQLASYCNTIEPCCFVSRNLKENLVGMVFANVNASPFKQLSGRYRAIRAERADAWLSTLPNWENENEQEESSKRKSSKE